MSESVATGNVSPETATGQEQTSAAADVQLSGSIFSGLGDYGAKSQANRILAAEERRRRVELARSEQVRAGWSEAVTALLATCARDRAHAEAPNPMGSLYPSAGLDPLARLG